MTPITIATVKSKTTVAHIVIKYCEIFVLTLLWNNVLISCQSFIRQAVTIKTPASADKGIRDISEPSKNIEIKITIEWKTLTNLVFPPALIATDVLAIAAVAGTPPNNGINIFPIPCAINSRSAFNFSFFILPALAPHKSDSIIPSAAILKAGNINCVIVPSWSEEKDNLASGNKVLGIVPTSWTGKFIHNWQIKAMIIPASEEGQYSPHFLGQISMITTTKIPKKTVGSDTGKPNFKYENSFSKALEPTDVVPKKLSICPNAIIIAIPLVKPVITLVGINETIFPNLNNDAIINIHPDKKLAMKTPCKPYVVESPIKIADIAPVGPEIW